MNLVISKCVTVVILSNFSGHYLRNRSTLDIGVLGYIGIVQHKENSPEVLSIPPGTLSIEEFSRVSRNNTRTFTTYFKVGHSTVIYVGLHNRFCHSST